MKRETENRTRRNAETEAAPEIVIPDGVVVRVIDLPPHVGAVTSVDEDECFNVYVNGNLTEEARERALRHELEHIRADHFYQKNRPVSQCESAVATSN